MDAILSGPCGKSGKLSPQVLSFALLIPYICLVSPGNVEGKKGFRTFSRSTGLRGSLPACSSFRAHLSFLLPLPALHAPGEAGLASICFRYSFSRPLGLGTRPLPQPFQHSEHQSYLCLWLIVVLLLLFFFNCTKMYTT